MQLPKLHERVSITQKANTSFGLQILDKLDKYIDQIDCGEIVRAYSQALINLLQETTDVIHPFQQDIEEVLSSVSKEHELTLGEQMKILSERIQNEVQYVIQWEREPSKKKGKGS